MQSGLCLGKTSPWLVWITDMRMGLNAARITIEDHLAELHGPVAHGQIAAGVQAEHYRGKVVGLYEDRLRVAHAE